MIAIVVTFIVIFGSIILILYGSYRLQGGFDPWFHYPFFGLFMIMVTEALYLLGQAAYEIGYSYDLVYIYFRLVQPFRILGFLIILYGVYRLFKKAEELVGVTTGG